MFSFISSQTDGFSDNVFPSEMATIASLVARAGGTEDEQVQHMADRMVDYARQCMKKKNRFSPFESMFVYMTFLLAHFRFILMHDAFLRRGRPGGNVLSWRGKHHFSHIAMLF